MPIDVFYDELLAFLERREARLLSWGFYDVSFRAPEVEASIATEAPASLRSLWESRNRLGETLPQHFGLMADAGLLHRIEDGGDRFRTRFAEGVRLTARLRQMFNANQWATAPTLVADVKLHLKPRRYPRQDQPATECWGDLEADAPRLAIQRDLFLALARTRDGSPIAFAGFQRRTFSHIFRAYGRDQLSGSIVSAGTGAGKTKAFYVPALLRVAAEIDRPPFTKVLAIYPRNVLLADQLREALSEAEKLRPVLLAQGLRPSGSAPCSVRPRGYQASTRSTEGRPGPLVGTAGIPPWEATGFPSSGRLSARGWIWCGVTRTDAQGAASSTQPTAERRLTSSRERSPSPATNCFANRRTSSSCRPRCSTAKWATRPGRGCWD